MPAPRDCLAPCLFCSRVVPWVRRAGDPPSWAFICPEHGLLITTRPPEPA